MEDPERPGTGLIALAKQSGPLRIRWSRPLPAGVRPVKLTVSRDRAGRFFVSVLVEERIEPLPPVFLRDGGAPKAVGLDLGLTALVTLDDGEKVDHPRLLKKYGVKLADLQRSLHRKERGSRNRDKARQEIELLRQLRYKCAWYGRTLVIVDRFFPSTRRCSACGVTGPKLDLSVRGWSCDGCGAVHDRDVNAARNLREEGLRLYALVASALPAGRVMPSVIKASEMPDVVLTA